MEIDFTGQIKESKEKDVLHKPFPTAEGYALFAKKESGGYVKVLFSSEEQIKNYLKHLGYDWGDEGKDEFTNFDNQHRLIKVLPELSGADSIAADPQWDPDKAPAETVTKHTSDRTMEDMPHLAVELREVDHQVTPASLAKKPDFLKKKGDKKDDKKNDKKDDKKNGKKGDKEEEGKDGKKLPPWLNKKKSKSNYSELWKKISGGYGGDLKVGDNVKNINPKCTHFKSEGVVKKFNKIPGDKGVTVAYQCTNAGKTWKKGDMLDKTPDQLTKGNCSGGVCSY
jgi:hypothetical protein